MSDADGRFKKIAFLARRPDLSPAEFARYWREVHGPTVAAAPGYAVWRHRYVQNHPAGLPSRESFAYDGIAEFWLPGPNEDLYALSETYRAHVRPDELNFIDMDRTVSVTARETVLRPGSGATKLFLLSRRNPLLDPASYAEAVVARSREACAGLDAAGPGVSLDLVLAGSSRLPGARAVPDPVADAIWTFRFADGHDAADPAVPDGLARRLGLADPLVHHPSGPTTLLATELVFYDKESRAAAS